MSEINLPPFFVGQKVVCVKSSPYLQKDKEYCVAALYYLACCKKWFVSVGISDYDAQPYCPIHHTWVDVPLSGVMFHNQNKFSATEENFQSISLEKVMVKETPLISVN